MCGSCRRLHASDQQQEAATRRHHQRHVEPVCRQIADEINRLRGQLLAHRSEQSAIVTGLLTALSIALGTPGNDNAASSTPSGTPSRDQATPLAGRFLPTTICDFNGVRYDLTRPCIAPDGSRWHWTRWFNEHQRPVATRADHTPGYISASADNELIDGHAYRYLARTRTIQQGQPAWKQ